MTKLEALVFDAYGTLYDVHSVTAMAEGFFPGRGAALSQLWRTKQLEYTWLRSLMGTYENFNVVTEAGLRYACAMLNLKPADTQVSALLGQYQRLDTFPEVKVALGRLKSRGKLAILSNGAPDTLGALVRHSGLDAWLDAVISVDPLRIFKPDMRVYQLAVERLAVPKARIGFVSSNCWDAIAAKTFGFTVFWINRLDAPLDLHGAAPDHVIGSLDDIEALL
jgi:2-haloacid dehalogenase